MFVADVVATRAIGMSKIREQNRRPSQVGQNATGAANDFLVVLLLL